MKFRAERDLLHGALATAARASGPAGPPVLAGLLLRIEGNRLSVVGTDLDLTLQSEIEVVGLADGACVIPSRLAVDVVKSMADGAVTAESEGDRVVLTAGRSRMALVAYRSEDFPVTDKGDETETIDVPLDELTAALRQVVRAASKDDSRPVLTAVLVASDGGNVRLVATDSYRLAIRDLEAKGFEEHKSLLIPARGMSELLRVARASGDGGLAILGASEHWASAHAGHVTLRTRVIAGAYPDYGQLLSGSFVTALTAGKEQMLAVIRRMGVVASGDRTRVVALSTRQGGVDVAIHANEVGDATESFDADVDGPDIAIHFNPAYLIDGLEAVEGDVVTLKAQTPTRPALICGPDSPGFTYLLMPVAR